MNNYVVFDFETTGLRAGENKICEIGAIYFDLDGNIISSYQTLVNPECIITDDLIAIHGITNEMIKDSPTIDQIMPDFISFLGCPSENVLIAHNLKFDWSFLAVECRAMVPFINPPSHRRACTMELAKMWIGNGPTRHGEVFSGPLGRPRNYKLGTLADYCGLPKNTAHRSIGDCTTTKDLFIFMSKIKGFRI